MNAWIIVMVGLVVFAAGPARAGLFIAKDVTMAMGFYTPEYRMAETMHGLSSKLSVGVGALYLRSDHRIAGPLQRELAYGQINYLLDRWFYPDGIANFYVFGGGGAARGNNFADVRTLLHYGGQADYETRRVYLSANVHWYRTGAFTHRLDAVQAGWAPYAADYEDWATWFVLRAERRQGLTTGTEVFPMLRVFRKDWWFELGRSTRGTTLINVMHTF